MKNVTIKLSILLLSITLFFCGSPPDINVTVPADWPIGKPFKVTIPGGKANIKLLTPNAVEKFKLVVYTSEKGGDSREIQITGDINGEEAVKADSLTKIAPLELLPQSQEIMDSFLRAQEVDAASKVGDPILPSLNAKFYGDGDPPNEPPLTANFKVLNSYSSLDSYTEVHTTRYSFSNNSVIYVDDMLAPEIKDDDAFAPAMERLRNDFDNIIAPIDRHYFGVESDIDGFQPIIILMTPVVSEIDTGGLGSVLGFFYSGDLFSDSEYPSSNETEIFYIAPPQFPQSIDYIVDNVSHGTLAHEFQHMINFNQHVLKHGGDSNTEALWINEGLSHLAEDITGYGLGNLGRINRYFSSPVEYPLATDVDTTGTRGASYLFLRYLLERFDFAGTGWLSREITQNLTSGTQNISESTGTDFIELYQDWLATLSISGSGVPCAEIYNYDEPIVPEDPSQSGPFQIGIDIRGINNGSQILSGPKTERLHNINLSLLTTSASFYEVSAINDSYLDLSLKLRNNSESGAIVIPTYR